jgi:hypothetical protein
MRGSRLLLTTAGQIMDVFGSAFPSDIPSEHSTGRTGGKLGP